STLLFYLSLYSIFFHLSHTSLDLHSFPTRRSSDLIFSTKSLQSTCLKKMPPGMKLMKILLMKTARRGCSTKFKAAFCGSPIFIRSEEHTSELQSRFDLVCRLLLEKKNNTRNRHTNE